MKNLAKPNNAGQRPPKPTATTAPPKSSTKPSGGGKGESEAKAPPKNKNFARQSQHSKELIKAFRPIHYFLTIIGQMPFVIKPKRDGTYSFKFQKCSFTVLLYFLMFFISISLYCGITLGILSFMLGPIFSYIQPTYDIIVKDRETKEVDLMLWERYMIRQEMVAIIVVWSWLTVSCAGSLYIVTNSKYYVHYMNYFNRVVQIMDMDMTSGVGAYILFNNLLTLSVALLLIAAFTFEHFSSQFSTVQNISYVIANFIFRLFNIQIKSEEFEEYEFFFQVLGLLIMIYALFGSRANVIQFLFFSQLLTNGSKIWNERLHKVLNHEKPDEEEKEKASQTSRRLEPKLVYKDHLMIVQLYQMTENVFGTILFSYYSLTIVSVVMELYHLASLQGFGTDVQVDDQNEDKEALVRSRRLAEGIVDNAGDTAILSNAAVSIILLGQNLYFCYITTVDAAKAYEFAMKGFDTLRRHGLMFCKDKTDRNFVLGLYLSFAKNNPLQLSAGGYFAVNKILLVTMASTMVNWAISVYQTKVDQWK